MTARCARLARCARQVWLELARGWAEVGSVCTLGGCLACCSTAVSQLYCNFQDGNSYIWIFEIFYGCMQQRSKDWQRPTGEARSPDVQHWFGWSEQVHVDRSKCEHPDGQSMLAFRSAWAMASSQPSGIIVTSWNSNSTPGNVSVLGFA